jgi:hypothetical protein
MNFHTDSPLQKSLGENARALVLVKDVELDALEPLTNVYGGDPSEFVSLISKYDIKTMEGEFKYCILKFRETGELDLLIAENSSGAHVGLEKIAEKLGYDVVMGGHIRLSKREGRESEVMEITNTSGHLQPKGTYAQQQVAEKVFMEIGLDAQGVYKGKKWDEKLGKYVGAQVEIPDTGTELKPK